MPFAICERIDDAARRLRDAPDLARHTGGACDERPTATQHREVCSGANGVGGERVLEFLDAAIAPLQSGAHGIGVPLALGLGLGVHLHAGNGVHRLGAEPVGEPADGLGRLNGVKDRLDNVFAELNRTLP
jgi:hypothetical protein